MQRLNFLLHNILENSPSCINLVFTSQPNLVVDSGVLPSLHPNAIIKVFMQNLTWKFIFPQITNEKYGITDKGTTELTRTAVHEFNWQRAFSNLNIHERVSFFNKTILNIALNFIPHETVICDDRDPPSINILIKNLIYNKKIVAKTQKPSQNLS